MILVKDIEFKYIAWFYYYGLFPFLCLAFYLQIDFIIVAPYFFSTHSNLLQIKSYAIISNYCRACLVARSCNSMNLNIGIWHKSYCLVARKVGIAISIGAQFPLSVEKLWIAILSKNTWRQFSRIFLPS